MTSRFHTDVVAVGEVMGLLDPDGEGPLEDAAHFTLRVAGAEANVLIAVCRLGHTASFVSAVGNDPVGRLVLRTLTEQGVDVSHVRVSKRAATGIFFKERFPDGVRRVYYYRRDSAASELDTDSAGLADLGQPRVLAVSGLTLGLGGHDGLGAVARTAIDMLSEQGTTVVFDANVRPQLWDGDRAARDFADIRRHVDVLLAGHDELSVLMPGMAVDAAAATLCETGMRAVVVKYGAEGAVVHESGRRSIIRPFPAVVVVDPVGAGDAFAAGVICGLLHEWDLADSARLGAALGARAVTVSGDWEAVPAVASADALLAEYLQTVGPDHETGRPARTGAHRG